MSGVRQDTRGSVYDRDGYCCRYCGRDVVRFTLNRDCEATVDHVVPRAAGGSNHFKNPATACWPCNQAKAAAGVFDFTPTEATA